MGAIMDGNPSDFEGLMVTKECLRKPIPEIAEAAKYLDEAVSAHLAGNSASAEELVRRANIPAIRDWTESLWGKDSPYAPHRVVSSLPTDLPSVDRVKLRMPTPVEQHELLQRDGYHCRFCGIPVIRMEVRNRIREVYSDALPWGRTNFEQHAAFQAMWVQYDHLVPYARGGTTDLGNIVITCAPCNYGRGDFTLEQAGLIDPRKREPVRSAWDGLERFRRL